jgi:hypothetical protein
VSGWEAVLAQDVGAAAIAAASDVAVRVSDRETGQAALRAASTQTSFPQTVRWEPCSVAQGDAGLALTCAYLDRCFPDAGWDVTAHGFLASAARSAEGHTLQPSLFAGLSGLGLVALLLGRDGSRYGRLGQSIDAALLPQALALAQSVRAPRDGLAVSQFDAISGLAGVGAYMLARREHAEIQHALERILEALVELVSDGNGAVPRWFTPPELLADETIASMYPNGSLNCGLAHGIPGPLALMALALSDGVEVPGLREATASAAAWIVAHSRDDEWGVNWPNMVSLPETTPERDEPSRAAWCYGSPGVARALWLAGVALADEQLTALSVEAMMAVYRRPRAARQIDSPTFCHGVAGLLQVTLRFARDTGLPAFTDAAADLTRQLLDQYDPEALLGFCSIEPGGNRVDQLGLLDGAPGVALVLLAASTDAEPTWDRLFLLA